MMMMVTIKVKRKIKCSTRLVCGRLRITRALWYTVFKLQSGSHHCGLSMEAPFRDRQDGLDQYRGTLRPQRFLCLSGYSSFCRTQRTSVTPSFHVHYDGFEAFAAGEAANNVLPTSRYALASY